MYYWIEPCGGCSFIAGVIYMIVTSTMGIQRSSELWSVQMCVVAICIWAVLAVLAACMIVCGNAGEIKRSQSTCYPIPDDAIKVLNTYAQSGRIPEMTRNI